MRLRLDSHASLGMTRGVFVCDIDCYDCKNCDESMHNAFNSDCYEVNRVKHPKRRNYNKAKTAIRLIKTATIGKTAIFR